MNTATEGIAVSIEDSIKSNPTLFKAVTNATEFFEVGLDHIDLKAQIKAINPAIRWSINEEQILQLEYREELPGEPPYHFRSKIPVARMLDAVDRKSLILQLLQSVNDRRYRSVIKKFEQMIQEREEAEANGQ